MNATASPLRASRRGSATVELMLTMAFLLMGVMASMNFTRTYHAHAKVLEQARTNAYTSATHSNENLFSWLVTQRSPWSPPGAPTVDARSITKTDAAPETPDAGDPAGSTQQAPTFDLSSGASAGSAEYGVFGFLVGAVDRYDGQATRSLDGIYLLDPTVVSKAGTSTMSARYVVCPECYREKPDPKAQGGWLTIDTLGWLKNSVSGLVSGLVSWMTDLDAEDLIDLLVPIPFGGWDFEK